MSKETNTQPLSSNNFRPLFKSLLVTLWWTKYLLMSNTVQDHFWKFYKQPVVYLYSAAVAPEIWKLRASKIKTSFGRTDPEKESLAAPDQALLCKCVFGELHKSIWALDQIQAEHNLLLERRLQIKLWRCWLRWTFTLLPVFSRWEPHFMCSHTCLCFDIPRYSFQKNYSGQHGYRQKCQWGSDVGHTACCRPGRAEGGSF